MPCLKSALSILLLCIHTCTHAVSEKKPPCPAEDRKDCAVKKPAPRRAVPQVIERVPPVAPAARTGVPVVVPPVQMPAPPPAVSTCDAGGCWDSGGKRYNGGDGGGGGAGGSGGGGAYTNGSGRLCMRNGTSMQCF